MFSPGWLATLTNVPCTQVPDVRPERTTLSPSLTVSPEFSTLSRIIALPAECESLDVMNVRMLDPVESMTVKDPEVESALIATSPASKLHPRNTIFVPPAITPVNVPLNFRLRNTHCCPLRCIPTAPPLNVKSDCQMISTLIEAMKKGQQDEC